MSPAARSKPPGPTFASERRRPIGEVAEEVRFGVLHHVRRRFERFGDLYYLENWGTPMYVTRHPDHIHEVLVTRGASFKKRTRDVEAFLGQGLLTSDGELWRRQRRLIQPAFTRERLERYAPSMVAEAERTVARWGDGDLVDLGAEMMALTLAVVCRTLLDHDPSAENDAVRAAMHALQSSAGVIDLFPRWLPTPLHLRQRRATRALDAIIEALVDARAQTPGGDDLVRHLLGAGEGAERMSRRQLRDELVTLYLAGHETTALALTWTFFLLARNPEHELRLHEELDRVLPDRPPAWSDLDALPFARLVLMEAMRMLPPLYLLPRIAREDTEVGGWPVPAGAEVLLWIYFAHHDPRWFPEPARFDPERFRPGSGRVRHPNAYVPFGAGQRACIGRNFALVEAQLVLATLARRFRVLVVPGQDVKLSPRVTLGPLAPIQVELVERRR